MSEMFGEILKGIESVGGKVGTQVEANPLKAGLTGIGALQSILAERKRNEILNHYLDLANNPEKSAAAVRSMTQPLNQGLVQDVGNQTQAYLGERGLSESPQITEAVLSQALAPYEEQNQRTAMDEYYRNLAMGLQSANPYLLPYEPDITSLLASWGKAPGTHEASSGTVGVDSSIPLQLPGEESTPIFG